MQKFSVPELTYAYDSLEPYIDSDTMELHHDKHHAAYVNKLNAAVEKHPEFFAQSVEDLLKNLSGIPSDIRDAVRNNGGGHFNHSFFWNILGRVGQPEGELLTAINGTFKSVESFRSMFENAAVTLFGSGWAWLSVDAFGGLVVHTTPNQDSPVTEGFHPVIGIDLWEHAYYLNYQNRRAEYVSAFWEVINWKVADANYRKALDSLELLSGCVSEVQRKVS